MTADSDENVTAARAAMDGYMAAFNKEDADALRNRWFHFPHVRFHSDKITIMETPQDLKMPVWERKGQSTNWGSSAWDYVELVDSGPNKVHFRVQFTRYNPDGSVIGSYKSFYILTQKDGQWGIQGRSSWAA